MNHRCKQCGHEFEGRAEAKFCGWQCSNRYASQHGIKAMNGRSENPTKRRARDSRIEWLGALNDRHTKALDCADCAELRRVALAYAAGDPKRGIRPMPRTAAQIMLEAG